MAANRDRSMNGELLEGMCDGTYKRILMNRSNYPDPDHRLQKADRLALLRAYGGYGVEEATEKRTPDGRFARI